jgi:hypothetical protein
VDDGVGVDRVDNVERLATVGEVGRAERDVGSRVDVETRVIVVDDDDFVVAGESVDDPAPGGAAAAGDENGLHTDAFGRASKSALLGGVTR